MSAEPPRALDWCSTWIQKRGKNVFEPVKDHRTAEQGKGKADKGGPAVLAFRPRLPGAGMRRRLIARGETGQHIEKESGHHDWRDEEAAGALDAPPEEGRGGDQRTDGKTELAPDAEKTHRRRLFVACQIVHQLGSLRMEGRDAQSTDHHGSDAHAVGGGKSGERDAKPYDDHGKRDQPGLRPAVGHVAKNRLKNGRDDVYPKDDGGGGGIREVMRGNEERQEDGYGPLIDVGGSMGNGKKPDGTRFHHHSVFAARRRISSTIRVPCPFVKELRHAPSRPLTAFI